MKFKYIAVLLIFFCSFFGNSQSKKEEGEILISEENLIHLIQSIREKRDANYLLSQQSKTVTPVKSEVNLTEVNSKLEALEYQLKYLTDLLESKNTHEEVKTEYFIVKNDKQENPIATKTVYATDTINHRNKIIYKTDEVITRTTDTVYKISEAYKEPSETLKLETSTSLKGTKTKPTVLETKNTADTKNTIDPVVGQSKDSNEASLKAIVRLERKIDSLFALNKANKEVVFVNNNEPVKNETVKADTVFVKNNNKTNYDLLKRKFSAFIENVYFTNNSSQINKFEEIDAIITILNSNENLDVFLKGFASNKGNALYNQELSFNRTETIKRYLISNGIHPRRILSQFHGIDYKSNNESEARRVELSFIIRK